MPYADSTRLRSLLPALIELDFAGTSSATAITNKAEGVVERFDRIDSVDSLRLARKVSQIAVSLGRSMPVLIELNIAREASKHGFDTEDLEMLVEAVGEVDSLGGINVVGLMTIGPLEGGPDRAPAAFAAMAELRARLAARLPGTDFGALSMGMSNDFESAIEYGSTEVRIGRTLFAPPGK